MQLMEEMSKLSITMDDMALTHLDAPFYLRGDFNVSNSHIKRTQLLKHFSQDHSLVDLHIPHKTYHHFLGQGMSDSSLDRIMFSKSVNKPETLLNIHCKLTDPLVASHHDLLVSSWTSDGQENEEQSSINVEAPILVNNRCRVVWSDEGIAEYQRIAGPHLLRIQELWLQNPTKTSLSLLLDSTNRILSSCAAFTNKTFPLDSSQKPRPSFTPKPVKQSQKALNKLNKELREAIKNSKPDAASLKLLHSKARIAHRKLERSFKAKASVERDQKLSKGSSHIFSLIRSAKRNKSGKIQKLIVGKNTYLGEAVKDGFYESISTLKSRDPDILSSSSFQKFSIDYKNILEVCSNGPPIPFISEEESFKIMQRMKPHVSDIFGITMNHFIYVGPSGWRHFHLLLNSLIVDINDTCIDEINIAYACILFKGHGKDKSSSRSYRTISTCPQVAKGLDLFVKDLNIDGWNNDQSEVQFQGEGSSHELAAVLLTETIQHSLFTLRQPVYVLYLDAQSAFDVVLRELLVRRVFHANTTDQSLLYLNNRLGSRKTIVDWNGHHMGPVNDEQGLEQGGVSSSDLYKMFGKEQLTLAQNSHLGVSLGEGVDLTISAIGQADDTLLVSNNIQQLQYLLKLTEEFCSRYHVTLSPGKTKLQVFFTKKMREEVRYAMVTNPIKLNDKDIRFSETAEHVGILRSVSGNDATILARITEHKKALGAVLHTGMARGHRGNPAASLGIEQLYGLPVLLSGLAPLFLLKAEEGVIEQHHKETVSNLQRLLPGTPSPVVFFLAGTLPGSGHLHIRQLSIFGMISRLTGNFLQRYVLYIFQSEIVPPKSWFHQISNLCEKYSLPSPLQLLENPMLKTQYKIMVKKNVVKFWEASLRLEAAHLPSLEFFKPEQMSLTRSHPIWTTSGSSPSNIVMASVQAHMLSGRYRTEHLCSHWRSHSTGVCLLSPDCSSTREDLQHILRHCPALSSTRDKLMDFTVRYCTQVPPAVSHLIQQHVSTTSSSFCQFLIDCSSLPDVVSTALALGPEVHHHLYAVTRTWVYNIHKERLRKLGRWNFL